MKRRSDARAAPAWQAGPRARGARAPLRAPGIVHDVLRAPGAAIDPAARASAEARFGRDFAGVRIHTDTAAQRSAAAVGAAAWTVGCHIAFAAGRYAPGSWSGRDLLAHELAHVAQHEAAHERDAAAGPIVVESGDSPAERAAAAGGLLPPLADAAGRRVLLRQPASQPPTPVPAGIARADFEERAKRRYGVGRVKTGTQRERDADLASRATARGLAAPPLPPFILWDPGPVSELYEDILNGLDATEEALGGLPPIDRIVFFRTNYEYDPARNSFTAQPDAGASFGAGELQVFSAFRQGSAPIPVERSVASGQYRHTPVAGVGGVPGQTPGAPLPHVGPGVTAARRMAHELGHGLNEAAHRAQPSVGQDWEREIGWSLLGGTPRLFDVQDPAVAAALSAQAPPPASAEITAQNWNHPRWKEQPMSHYSVSGGPGEDFAEAVMAYVYEREALRARSPARFNFIEGRLPVWRRELRKQDHGPGDFPLPDRIRRMA